MEGVLLYLLAGSRGGPTRARVVRALEERPRNANRLAEHLDLDVQVGVTFLCGLELLALLALARITLR